MHRPDELRALVESFLDELELSPELGGLEQAVRYPLESGGKRIRPVLCLAVGEAAGSDPERCLPAAAAIELVHTFSLVHDDLPALDDDDERRGRPSAHVAYGEGVAVLAGDALLAEAFRLALSYPTPAIGTGACERDARDDRRAVPRRDGLADRSRGAAPTEDGRPLLGGGRDGALGGRAPGGGTAARGARLAPSSACSSRSWTTCSTETALRSSTVPRARERSETRPPNVLRSGWKRSRPTPRYSRSSSPASPPAPPDRSARVLGQWSQDDTISVQFHDRGVTGALSTLDQ